MNLPEIYIKKEHALTVLLPNFAKIIKNNPSPIEFQLIGHVSTRPPEEGLVAQSTYDKPLHFLMLLTCFAEAEPHFLSGDSRRSIFSVFLLKVLSVYHDL